MRKSRFSDEQVMAVLREADREPMAAVAKRHGVSEQTIYTWRERFGTFQSGDVRRLKQLEAENAERAHRHRHGLRTGIAAIEATTGIRIRAHHLIDGGIEPRDHPSDLTEPHYVLLGLLMHHVHDVIDR